MNEGARLFDQSGQRLYVNAVERQSFLRAAQAEPDAGAGTLCQTLLYTGCRVSEALNLQHGSIDWTDSALIFRTLKQRRTDRFRSVPIPGRLLQDLKAHVTKQELGPEDQLWRLCRTTAWKSVKACMDEANITGAKATCKGLRHGFAIACAQSGVPLTVIQRWLGHSRLETTSIYLSFTGEEEQALARRTWPDV